MTGASFFDYLFLEMERLSNLPVFNSIFSHDTGGEMSVLFKPGFLALILLTLGTWLWFLYISARVLIG